MNQNRFKSFLRLLLYLVGIIFFVYFFQKNLIAFLNNVDAGHINFKALVFSILIIFLIYFLQMVNFWYVVNGYDEKLSLRSTVIAYSSSFMPKYIPGYIWGYVSRGEAFKNLSGISYKTTIVASIIEILYFVSSGILILGARLILLSSLNNWLILLLLLIPLFEWVLLIKLGNRLLRFLKIEGTVVLRPQTWFIVFVISLVEWFLYGLSLHQIHLALSIKNIPVSFIQLLNYSSIFSEAWIAGFVAFLVPMGLGIRELILTNGFKNIIGASVLVSGMIASVSRITIIFSEGLWFVLGFVLLKVTKNKR
ncbi:MAG: hypothetical protein VB108_09115 [Anaerolineaceae bacterium]|nr:hypothetical protein [Anaerolineaceae bacterium]